MTFDFNSKNVQQILQHFSTIVVGHFIKHKNLLVFLKKNAVIEILLFIWNMYFYSFITNRECNENDCPSWTEWSTWGECSTTCGGGTCQRQRMCKLPDGTDVPSTQCSGTDTETKTCNENKCPGKHRVLCAKKYVQSLPTYLV